MIFIAVPYHTPRIKYVLDYIFRHRLGLEYTMVDGSVEIEGNKPVIYYSKEPRYGISIFDFGFLNETDIKQFEPEIQKVGEAIYLFPVNEKVFSLSYDIFSAVFYLISRYEEYLPYTKDIYGRFDAEQSVSFRNDFHQRALVDEYVKQLAELLLEFYPDLSVSKEVFDYRITVDVDMVFSYRGKGFARNAGGWVRDFVRGRMGAFLERPFVLAGLMRDPYNTFAYFKEAEQKAKFPFTYFILFAKERSNLDKNTSRKHRKTRKQICQLVKHNITGLHPSFAGDFEEEKAALEQVCNTPVTISRQHYLRMTLPDTYSNLENAGFTDDYTMGFASVPGYRAGTSRPFPFFNLAENRAMSLMVHPFSVMDGSYKDYNDLSAEKVMEKLQADINYLRKINGRFCMLLHNETLSESRRWKGWRTMFYRLIDDLNGKEA